MTRLPSGVRAASFVVFAAVIAAACGKSDGPAATARGSGVDQANFDPKVRPQDDFFRHVNGGWIQRTEIPADKSNYGAFTVLADRAEEQLKAIIEQAAANKDKRTGTEEQKVGDLYASFMDEARAAGLGITPLDGELARIDALADRKDIPVQLAHFSRIGVSNPIYAYVDQDEKIATQYIVHVSQARPYYGDVSGLGLPDRDYYLSADPKFKAIRAEYAKHVEKMLALAGVKDAAKAAKSIVDLETRIAKLHWTRVEDRDDDKTYHKMDLPQLNALTTGFDWKAYLHELDVEKTPGVIVRQPSYFAAIDDLLREVPLPELRTYFKWHLIKSYANYLSPQFVDERFRFAGGTLKGIKENRPRWKRGVEAVQVAIGEALGKIYVERHFPPEAKKRTEQLVDNLKLAYHDSIGHLEWMSPETRQRALEKLAKFNTKIGYPDKWKDYSALSIRPDDLVGNMLRANEADFARDAAKLGGPIDRDEWGMTPQTVNAYYNAGLNEIVFPAAILQPPFFNASADDAVNYGAIGGVIGHEIGHGFDDQGSKADGDGNLKSWWTTEDRAKFEERTRQLIAQYDRYCPFEGQCVNGALTVGENIGDLGGLFIAYQAYRKSLNGKEAPVIDGFTGDQRFFIGWAQVWARKYRDQELLERLKTDSHSPAEYRVNGIVIHMPEFYAAFNAKPGDKMYLAPESRLRIW
jgi:putative endopeptidase